MESIAETRTAAHEAPRCFGLISRPCRLAVRIGATAVIYTELAIYNGEH